MNVPGLPAWLAASIAFAASIWAVEQFDRRYAWTLCVLGLLSILIVRLRERPDALRGLFLPWEPAG